MMLGCTYLSLSDLLFDYRSRRSTPEVVVRMAYARIRAAGNDHAWIELVPEDEALKRARRLTENLRDLPLYGIPFAVKDNIDVAGLPTTAACPSFAYTPGKTATAVERALAAGAILIGKTNMDQFATGLVGTRSPYGACASVFHPDYVAGGSSSGSALAVAKGQVCFALGTDTAGSGRVPAAFNGIVGVKPSRGLISMAGVVPACKSLDCLSVFAPDLETGRRVFDAIRGPDQADPYSRTGELQPWTGESPVLGVPKLGSAGFFGDGLAANCWNEAIAKAKRLGAELIEIELEPFQEAAALLYSGPFVAERYAAVGTFVETEPEASVDPTVRQIILDAARYSAADAHRAMYRLEDLKRQCSAILSRMDALLLPTTPTHYRIAEVQNDPILLNARLGTYTNFVNLLDLCGIALPAGMRADGLPFGVTILGPAFADWKMFGLAHWWQETEDSSVQRSEPAEEMVQIAVVGAHLTGQPLNWQLTHRGGTLVRTTRTASLYRLYALTGTTPRKPGLIRVQDPQEQGIEVEVWQLSPQEFGSFVAEIPPPLGIGTLELEDRTQVKGFLCEPYALDDAEEITHLGGWRNYLSQLTPAHASA